MYPLRASYSQVFFRKVGDVYKLTEYANELVKISLVNGSADRRTNTSVLYKDMSKGDYLLTGLMNYVKNEEKTVVINSQEHKFATANFFYEYSFRCS